MNEICNALHTFCAVVLSIEAILVAPVSMSKWVEILLLLFSVQNTINASSVNKPPSKKWQNNQWFASSHCSDGGYFFPDSLVVLSNKIIFCSSVLIVE